MFRSRRRRCEPGIGREDRDIEPTREFHIERVDEAEVVTPLPGAGEHRRESVALDGSGLQPINSRGDLACGQMAGTMEAPQGREDFGVEVRGGVKLMAVQPVPYRRRRR